MRFHPAVILRLLKVAYLSKKKEWVGFLFAMEKGVQGVKYYTADTLEASASTSGAVPCLYS